MQSLRQERNSSKRNLILVLGLGALLYFLWGNRLSILNRISTRSPQSLKPTLESTVKDSLSGANGRYGVVVTNLKSGETALLNEHQSFETGSIYKLWVMATVYKQIEDQKLKEDDVVSDDIKVLNNDFGIDPETAELAEGTITLSVRDALTQMITISHNYAALLLVKRAGLSSVAEFLKNESFKDSSLGATGGVPISTPEDVAAFYEKLYRGELANSENTKKMLDLLKNQKLNNGLPKYLPADSIIAHKTGDIGWFKHDSGIVFTKRGDYIIVILSESDSPSGAQERIASTSKAVYDYFQTED